MSHTISFYYKDKTGKGRDNEHVIQLSGSNKRFERSKIFQQPSKDNTIALDGISIYICSRMQTTKQNESQNGEQLLVSRITSVFDILNKNQGFQLISSLTVQIDHQSIPIISLILQKISDSKQLQSLIIESVQPFTDQQKELFTQILTEKLVNLQILHYIVQPTKDSTHSIQKQQSKNIVVNLQELSICATKQIEDLQILEFCPNIHTLKLSFPIIFSNSFIEQTLKKVSELVPSIKIFELKIINKSPCELSPLCNLSNLLSIKIQAESSIELDLSKLKNLTSVNLEFPDPLSFFCKQRYLENLQKLFLFNIGGVLKSPLEECKNIIQEHQKTIIQYKHLNSLIYNNSGYNSPILQLVKRDLEIVSVIVSQLQVFEINLVSYTHLMGKEIDHELSSILCSLLDKCKQEIRINYSFFSSLMSIEDKCDLSLAIRRLRNVSLFSLNDKLVVNEIANSLKAYQNSISIKNNAFEDDVDHSIFLVWLGPAGVCPQITNKVLQFSKNQIEILKNSQQNDEKVMIKTRDILSPFHKVQVENFFLQVQFYLSKDLTSLTIEEDFNLKVIDEVISQYPKLINIKGRLRKIQNFLSKVPIQQPKKIIELNLTLSLYDFFSITQIFNVQHHFIKLKSNSYQVPFNQAKEILELMIKSDNRILIQFPSGISCMRKEQKIITGYYGSITCEIAKIFAFYSTLADLLPLNPKIALIDFYFN